MSDISKINVGGTTYGISGTSLIAPVETSSTASQQYLEGDQFVYNGVLYKATTTIPNGGTITVGSNCQLAGDVTSQISEISSNLFKGSISVTGDGTKTYKQLLNELYALIDDNKLSVKSVLKDATSVMPLTGFSPTTIGFSQTAASATTIYVSNYNLSTNSTLYSSSNNTISDYSNTVVTNGRVIELIY